MSETSNNSPRYSSVIFHYFEKYLPNILELLLTNRKINREEYWKEKDLAVNNYFASIKLGDKVETNLFDIIRMAEQGMEAKLSFLMQFDDMCFKLLNSLDDKFKKKVRGMFEGKVFNLDGLNYLSPVGELLFLYKLHFNNLIKVLDIEHELEKGKTTFDFLVEINGKKLLIDVYNVHPKSENEDYLEDIGKKILEKYEIKKSTHTFDKFRFLLAPIVWFTEKELSDHNNTIRYYFDQFYRIHIFKVFQIFSVYSRKYDNARYFIVDFLNNHLDALEKQKWEDSKVSVPTARKKWSVKRKLALTIIFIIGFLFFLISFFINLNYYDNLPNKRITLFGAIISGLVSFIASLMVFSAGIFKGKISEERRLSNVRELLKATINAVHSSIVKQIEHLDLAIRFDTLKNYSLFPNIVVEIGILGTDLSKFNKEDMFKIFILNYRSNKEPRIQAYQRFVSNLPLLEINYTRLKDIKETVVAKYNETFEKLFDLEESYKRLVLKGKRSANSNEKLTEYYSKASELLEENKKKFAGDFRDLRDFDILGTTVSTLTEDYLEASINNDLEEIKIICYRIKFLYNHLINFYINEKEHLKICLGNFTALQQDFEEILEMEYKR